MNDRSGASSLERPDPPRPLPDRRPGEVVAAWWTWVGPLRLVTSAVCVAVVVAGGWWLVRAPSPATEATLPMAGAPSSGSAPPAATLPVPSTPPVPEDVTQRFVVHVAGRVRSPGVYDFDAAPRVYDVIERAGGASDDADLDALNLAQPLADGQRVYVPAAGEVEPSEVLAPQPAAASADSTPALPVGPIDVNRATAAELETLPGVGPATAAAIIDDRDRNGPFAAVDDLDRVPGIGPAKLAALRDLVTV